MAAAQVLPNESTQLSPGGPAGNRWAHAIHNLLSMLPAAADGPARVAA